MLKVEAQDTRSVLRLPGVPSEQKDALVACWVEPMDIDTYLPEQPNRYPAFLDKRVYQGSSGRVFPLPFHERISQQKAPHTWNAIHLENEWIRLVILPELGGRIHVGYDKLADYDFFYRNNVIKPALVGLAGPWISGGVEFNWPQHHRPATFLPTDFSIEREADGAITVWCSDHDPFTRMKGMHGIRLRPDSAAIEARVRLFNRTDEPQTFLWWANVAAAANDDYQSFFPSDVHFVADHARRDVVSFPEVSGSYYGVDYPAQKTAGVPDGDRLDWYRNIPVPTSYMVMSSQDDFFGGYDHARQAGFVHIADRAVAPGKKQWTWGHAAFGQAWDANLTDTDGPYVELMAGAFTDNQPDFAYIGPGETKAFSQFWYPIQKIGVVHQATARAAVHLDVVALDGTTTVSLGIAAAGPLIGARVQLLDSAHRALFERVVDIRPGEPMVLTVTLDGEYLPTSVTLLVSDVDGDIIRWTPRAIDPLVSEAPVAAVEPPLPAAVASVEELYFIGEYLAQYRHATRQPEPYWREALRRDPGDVRSNTALSSRLLRAGDFEGAELLLLAAVERATARVSTPMDGGSHYRLGLALVHQGRDAEAQHLFDRAAWDAKWRIPANLALARLHLRAGDDSAAERALNTILVLDSDHLQAANLLALVFARQGYPADARATVLLTLKIDPLDQWAQDLAGADLTMDAPTLLDVALEYFAVADYRNAVRLLDAAAEASAATALGQVQVGPLVQYHRARCFDLLDLPVEASQARREAALADRDCCNASRLEDVAALRSALAADPSDGLAHLLLGNWLYDRGRQDDAIEAWERAAEKRVSAAIAERNLGIARYNVQADVRRATEHYDRALALSPRDSKLLFEADQLAERAGLAESARLSRLKDNEKLVFTRDDLTVVFVRLLVAAGEEARALAVLIERQFQPWEGGEGQVIDAWDLTNLALSQRALDRGDGETALRWARNAMEVPANLGEARHPLANGSRVALALGDALAAADLGAGATAAWQAAAAFSGDFAGMATQEFSDHTVYTIAALHRLHRDDEAADLVTRFSTYLDELQVAPATVDFFATSLPLMLLFTDDPTAVRDARVHRLRQQIDSRWWIRKRTTQKKDVK